MIAVACIDLFYYRRLLQGAVTAILDIEAQTAGRIALSTKIEERAKRGAEIMPWVFYVLGLLPVIAIVGWAIYQLGHVPADVIPSPPAVTPTIK